ncbi:MAG: hypothetical protein K0S71_768 [Clostridia bacterium]|jgi:hypothetical protein|nr:hypothetical protein [Clostridia bacterium]
MSSFDSAVNNDFLMISKSLVPYLDADKQKAVAIFIKAFELMSTIDLFSKEEFVRSITKPRDPGWEKSFLSDIREIISDDRGFFIDAVLKLSEVRELLAVKNNEQSTSAYTASYPAESAIPTQNTAPPNSQANNMSNNSAQILDKLSGVLDPNQMQILKMLSAFIK